LASAVKKETPTDGLSPTMEEKKRGENIPRPIEKGGVVREENGRSRISGGENLCVRGCLPSPTGGRKGECDNTQVSLGFHYRSRKTTISSWS